MRHLIFDQNLSTQLPALLVDLFPEALHVRPLGLMKADDLTIWRYARDNDLIIVSKDGGDFRHYSFLFGFPPKVLWVRLGNCSTSQVEALLRRRYEEIEAFSADEEAAFLGLL